MVELAERTPNVGAVGATVLRADRRDEVEMLGGARVNRVNAMISPAHAGISRTMPKPANIELDYVSCCCLLISASAFAQVGVIDERFFLYSEDVDWGLRMQRAGLRLVYAPDAEVWHKGGASVVHRSATHDYYMVRAALLLVQKHNPAMLPVALIHWLWRGILPKLMRGEWSRLAAASRGYADFLLRRSGERTQ